MSGFYVIVQAEGYDELERAVQSVILGDASWQPLGGPIVRDRYWFQAVYRRPSVWKRLELFVRKAFIHGQN